MTAAFGFEQFHFGPGLILAEREYSIRFAFDFTYRGFEERVKGYEDSLTIVQVDRIYKIFQDVQDEACES